MSVKKLLVTLLLGSLLTGCATNQQDRPQAEYNPELLQRQLDLGIGYLRNGDYTRAKDKLNRALEIDPKSAVVHATFGLLFQLEGENSLAEKYFKDAVRYDPDSAQARNSYGAFLFAQERYEEAVEQLEKASENRFYQNRPTVFQNLGVAYLRLGNVERAEYAFTRSIQLFPEQTRALIELADLRFDQRNYVEARELYNRHKRLVPTRNARTLWLCVRLARVFNQRDEEASCAEALEGIYPASEEYQLYKESL